MSLPLKRSYQLKKLAILAMFLSIGNLYAQTVFWSDNFDAPAGGTNNNNAGANWSGSLPTPNGGQNTSIFGTSNDWTISNATRPTGICTAGNKLYIHAVGSFGSNNNTFESDVYTDKYDATPNISTVGVTNITLGFAWRCNGTAGADYGLVGLSPDGGATWNWLPTQYQGSSTCQTASITIPNTYENITNFKVAYRFIGGATSCGSCDPPFDVDNITLTGTVAVVGCPLTIASQTSTNPTCHGANDGTITITTAGSTNVITYTINSGTPISNTTGVFTGLAPGTYTIQASDTCTVNGTSITITDPAAVAAPTASNNGPLCAGATLNLTASTVTNATYNWTGPNNFSNTQNPSKANVTTGDAGTYSVVATVGGCNSAPATTTVVVNTTPPTPTASNNGPVCEGSPLNLSASSSGATGYSWTGPNTYNVQNPSIASATLADAGTYTVVASIGSCNSAPATTTVVVNPTPSGITASNNGPLCVGDALNLTATTVASATYAWTGPNSFNVQNPNIASVAVTDSGIYTVVVTLGNCSSAPVTTHVVIAPPPTTPVASNDGPVCEGSTLNFSATSSNGATFTWTGPNNLTGANPSIASASLSDAGTYTVVANVGSCASSPATTTVTVNPTPVTPTAANNGPLCEGDNLVLTGSLDNTPGIVYNWTGPNGFGSSNQIDSVVGVTVANAGTYSLYTSLGSCNSAAVTTTAVINAVPATPTASNSGPVCAGASLDLTASSTSSGVSYNWTGPNNFTNIQNPNIAVTTLNDSGVYTVVAVAGVCASAPATTTVTITPGPAAPTVSNDGPVCVGGTVNLTASTIANATYSWTGPNNYNVQNPTIASATSADSGIYYVIATVAGCNSIAASTLVVVNQGPAAPAVSNNGPLCVGDNLQLTAGTVANATYNWTGPNNFSTQNPTVTGVTANDAGTYTLVITVAGCSSNSTTTQVIVNPIPAAPTATSNSPVCSGTQLQLTASTVANATYSWTGPNSFNTQNPTVATATSNDAGTYTVIATVNGCNSAPATTTVSVTAAPAAPVASSNSPVCVGGTLQLNATGNSGATYTWTGPNSNNFTTQNPSKANITSADAGTYSVVATASGCTSGSSNTITVVVNPAPTRPTVTANDTLICADDSAQVCVPSTYAAYQWNTGPTTACFYARQAGNYYVTVTDANGCTAASTNHLAISVRSVPSINITQNGDTLRAIGGTAYQWYLNGVAIPNATSSMYIAKEDGQYSVLLTDANGCKALSTAVNITVGIAYLPGDHAFSIYPNPVSDKLVVDFGTVIQSQQIEIFDITGRRLNELKSEGSKTEINVAHLSAGTYVVKVGNVVSKFVKE